MDKCNLHTILRLPTGIFYAQGVKTNVLFFTRGDDGQGQHQGGLGLRPARQHAAVRQAHPAHPRALRASSRPPSATIPSAAPRAWQAQGHRRNRPLPQVHPRVDRRARRQPRHRLAQRRQRGDGGHRCPNPPCSPGSAMQRNGGAWPTCGAFLAELGEEVEVEA